MTRKREKVEREVTVCDLCGASTENRWTGSHADEHEIEPPIRAWFLFPKHGFDMCAECVTRVLLDAVRAKLGKRRPFVVGDRVVYQGVHGTVYCLDPVERYNVAMRSDTGIENWVEACELERE